jgi:hypothetical protein
MRVSKRGLALLLTFLFSVAATLLPVPFPSTGWKPWIGTLLWGSVLFFGYLFLESEFQSLRQRRKNTKHYIVLTVVFLVFGCLGVGLFALFESKEEKTAEHRERGPNVSPSPSPATPSPNYTNQITDLGKRLDKLTDAVAKSPSVDPSAQLSILKDEHDKLSEKKDELTKQQRETLDEQGFTIDSLEKGRKLHLQTVEAEQKQKEVAEREAEINRQQQQKAFQQEFEAREKRFAEPYIPCTDYAVTALYELLRSISSVPISSDFPGSRPSMYNSRLLKDGRFIDGEQVIRLSSNKEWEFHIVTSGNTPIVGPPVHKYLGFQIRAGTANMSIGNEYKERGVYNPSNALLRISCRSGDKELYSETCSLSEYQRPIQAALKQLIQTRYNEFPLNGDAGQTSRTPDTDASPK